MTTPPLILLLLSLLCGGASSDKPYTICNPNKEVCEYWLVLEEKLTMVHESNLVYGHDGQLYRYNEHWTNATNTVSPDEVITVDGFQRMVIAINNSLPGPPIIMYEGQIVSCVFYHILQFQNDFGTDFARLNNCYSLTETIICIRITVHKLS